MQSLLATDFLLFYTFLVTGEAFEDLKFKTAIAPQTLHVTPLFLMYLP
jgi:hypothetical protein